MKSSPHTCPINKGFWVGNKIVNGTAVIPCLYFNLSKSKQHNLHRKVQSEYPLCTKLLVLVIFLQCLLCGAFSQSGLFPQGRFCGGLKH